MNPAHEDLVARRKAWSALSDLYLDTDPALSYEHAACTLAQSAYAMPELRDILFTEVHPALYLNLLGIAGIWSGFDDDWLAQRIVDQQAAPRWGRARGWLLLHYARALWRELEPRIVDYRCGRRTFLPLPAAESA